MSTRPHQTGLAAIAVFKLVKDSLLLLLGLGLLKLMHADIATLFSRLIEALHLNADSRIIHALVLRGDALHPRILHLDASPAGGEAEGWLPARNKTGMCNSTYKVRKSDFDCTLNHRTGFNI